MQRRRSGGVAKRAALASQPSSASGDINWEMTSKGLSNACHGGKSVHRVTMHCHQALPAEVARPV